MLDLDFIKKIDNNWEKRITRLHIEQFNEKYCPICKDRDNI